MLVQILICVILLYILWFYLENFTKTTGRPPGPLRIPPFGNLIQMGLQAKDAYVALHELSKKHGSIMSIKMGLIEAVVFTSIEATRQVFTKEEAAGRDCSGILFDRNFGQQRLGFVLSEGPECDETRLFCRDTMKIYGYGNRAIMCNMLLDEITEFIKFMEIEINSNPERKFHFASDGMNRPYLNLMSTWIMGKRYNYDDSEFQNLLKHEHDLVKNGAVGAGIIMAYPFLRFIIPKLLGYDIQMRGMRGFQEIGLRFLEERRQKGDYNSNPTCFTDYFLQKMDEDSQKANPLYTEKHFAILHSDILQAGSDTASNVLNMTLLHIVANQKIQEKVFQEISTVIGNNRLPQLEDKQRMPFTQAVILEGIRWTRVLVLGVPRKTMQDFSYRDFHFKKGTILMFNIHSIFFDEETWGDPHVFRPERFIDLQGNIDPTKQEIVYLGFGTGKRICFGEVVGRDSLFIFITTLIQKFKFSLPPGAKPNLEPQMGISLFAMPYDAIVTQREN